MTQLRLVHSKVASVDPAHIHAQQWADKCLAVSELAVTVG